MKYTKITAIILITAAFTLCGCSKDDISIPISSATQAPAVTEAPTAPAVTYDYSQYLGTWYAYTRTDKNGAAVGQVTFSADGGDTMKARVDRSIAAMTPVMLSSVRFTSANTACSGEGVWQGDPARLDLLFKQDGRGESTFEMYTINTQTGTSAGDTLYFYRTAERTGVEPVQPAQQPAKTQPAQQQTKKSSSSYYSKREEFTKRANALDSRTDSVLNNATTQSDMNIKSNQMFNEWDALLNEIYQYLKNTLPTAEYTAMRDDERAWIKRKEAAIDAAGAEWRGGSGEPYVRNTTAISYTKDRCYYLISLIQ